ncbi:hypothetical protein WJX72_000691 [[Myrmecia] bisecta]|uniref:Uncharacterized protein n=1 Tax=[Myrmecia] bisecta TaxID=41462 RepID=A0AAW1QE06_9CHLO
MCNELELLDPILSLGQAPQLPGPPHLGLQAFNLPGLPDSSQAGDLMVSWEELLGGLDEAPGTDALVELPAPARLPAGAAADVEGRPGLQQSGSPNSMRKVVRAASDLMAVLSLPADNAMPANILLPSDSAAASLHQAWTAGWPPLRTPENLSNGRWHRYG